MKHYLNIFFVNVALLLSIGNIYAQNDQDPISDELLLLQNLSAETEESELQKYLNIKVSASSKKELTTRETPGIVSVITEDEIRRSGASDLMEILEMVPGFDFGHDVDFMVGIGLRGNWSNEGKVLLLIDGMEYNELLYQSIPFGNHFSVDQIDKIEIIRGPGSAIYGGTAEYGVISIITKGGNGFKGINAYGEYGVLSDGVFGRSNYGFQAGTDLGNGIYGDIAFHKGSHTLSDQDYQDLYYELDPVNLRNHSATNTTNINAGLKIKDFQVRAFYDVYDFGYPAYSTESSNFSLDFKYDIKINDKLKLIPRVTYTQQEPWVGSNLESGEIEYKVFARRSKFNLTGVYDVTRKLNLIAGVEGFQDYAKSSLDDDNFGVGVDYVNYNNLAAFAQGLLIHPLVNITFGFRYDYHNIVGGAFVPRFGLTKRIENFHFKALYSHSYRAPGIENLNLNDELKPERSKTTELELGYQFTPDMLLSLNAYYTKTKDAIVYEFFDLGGGDWGENFTNGNQAGSKGLELTYRFIKKRFSLNTNYSLYSSLKSNDVDTYLVPGQENIHVAFPTHKIVVNSVFEITENLWTNIALIYKSKRYGYTDIDEDWVPIISELDPYTKANFSMGYDNFLLKGLLVKASITDIFNSKAPIIQAYNGDYAPIPGRSSELKIKLAYNINLLNSGK